MSDQGQRHQGHPHQGQWSILSRADDAAVSALAAAHVAECARAAVADHGRFTFAVSGGRTPWKMFAELVHEDMPWAATDIYQVDERITGADDPDRNLLHLRESLGSAPARVHPMPVESPDLEQAAAEYARDLPPAFDLIHLGLGPDGHTASLVPDDPILQVADRAVAITGGEYQGHRRMSLTYPTLDAAAQIMWLVTGSDKVTALRGLLDHDEAIPAGRVRAVDNVVITDDAARGD